MGTETIDVKVTPSKSKNWEPYNSGVWSTFGKDGECYLNTKMSRTSTGKCYSTSCDHSTTEDIRNNFFELGDADHDAGCGAWKKGTRKMYVGPNSEWLWTNDANRHAKPCPSLDGARRNVTRGNNSTVQCTYDIDELIPSDGADPWGKLNDILSSYSKGVNGYPQLNPLKNILLEKWCDINDRDLNEDVCGPGAIEELLEDCKGEKFFGNNKQRCKFLKEGTTTQQDAYNTSIKTYCDVNSEKDECACLNQKAMEGDDPLCSIKPELPGCEPINEIWSIHGTINDPVAKRSIEDQLHCFRKACYETDNVDMLTPTNLPDACLDTVQICNVEIDATGAVNEGGGTFAEVNCDNSTTQTVNGDSVSTDIDGNTITTEYIEDDNSFIVTTKKPDGTIVSIIHYDENENVLFSKIGNETKSYDITDGSYILTILGDDDKVLSAQSFDKDGNEIEIEDESYAEQFGKAGNKTKFGIIIGSVIVGIIILAILGALFATSDKPIVKKWRGKVFSID